MESSFWSQPLRRQFLPPWCLFQQWESSKHLSDVLDQQVAASVAHALCMAVSYFNNLSLMRKRKLSRAVKDPLSSCWLDDNGVSGSIVCCRCGGSLRSGMGPPHGWAHLLGSPGLSPISFSLFFSLQQGQTIRAFPSLKRMLALSSWALPHVRQARAPNQQLGTLVTSTLLFCLPQGQC